MNIRSNRALKVPYPYGSEDSGIMLSGMKMIYEIIWITYTGIL